MSVKGIFDYFFLVGGRKMLKNLASFKFVLHFFDVVSCLVPMIKHENEKARTVKKSINHFLELMKDVNF